MESLAVAALDYCVSKMRDIAVTLGDFEGLGVRKVDNLFLRSLRHAFGSS